MSTQDEQARRQHRLRVIPPAAHQTASGEAAALHSASSGVTLLRSAQARPQQRHRARRFARERAEEINAKHPGEASVFLYEETFGVDDRLHWMIHLRSLDSYYTLVEAAGGREGHDSPNPPGVAPDPTDSAALFVPGSAAETVLMPQFWGMYGTKVDGVVERRSSIYREGGSASVPPARLQTTQADDDVLHSTNAGVLLHRSAQLIYDFRSEARAFGRNVAESINDNLAGEATVFVYEEAFGHADRLHWLIHLRDLTSYQRVLELHVRNEAVRDMYFEELIAPERGGGTWARMFVEGSMVDLALSAHHWGFARPAHVEDDGQART